MMKGCTRGNMSKEHAFHFWVSPYEGDGIASPGRGRDSFPD